MFTGTPNIWAHASLRGLKTVRGMSCTTVHHFYHGEQNRLTASRSVHHAREDSVFRFQTDNYPAASHRTQQRQLRSSNHISVENRLKQALVR